jgi:hypothetical protein
MHAPILAALAAFLIASMPPAAHAGGRTEDEYYMQLVEALDRDDYSAALR